METQQEYETEGYTAESVRKDLACITQFVPGIRTKIGAAIFSLGWGEFGRSIWIDWSKTLPQYNEVEHTKLWARFTLEPPTGPNANPAVICMFAEAKLDNDKSAIVQKDGELNEIIDAAEASLIKAGQPIYSRGGELVIPDKHKPREDDEVTRGPGATIIVPLSIQYTTQLMARSAKWRKLNKIGMQVPADPRAKYADGLMKRPPSKWKFPVLKGISKAPTLDFKGEIIETPGYDEGSQLLLDFAPGNFPEIPEHPTHEDAIAALAVLNHPLRGFPFDGEDENNKTSASRSVALSAVMTALVRHTLRAAPLHAYDASVAGTGKSKLADEPALLAMGTTSSVVSQGADEEEDEKRLSSVMRQGDPIILIDNCTKPLQGDFMCSLLTQQSVQFRVLGESKTLNLPCNVFIQATGNNLTFAGDMTRRGVRCRLDAKMENPEEREFDWDFHDEVRANRGALVVAALTVLKAYRLAGSPGLKDLKPMGSFEDWSWIRGALVWCGHVDPAESRNDIIADDPVKNATEEIITLWSLAWADKPVTVTEIGAVWADETSPHHRLKVALQFAAARGQWNPILVGRWIKKNSRRPINGRYFQDVGKLSGSVVWQLRKLEKAAS